MAYLTLAGSEEKQNTCFKFIGANTSETQTTHLISNNTSLISATLANGGMDTCSFYSGPSDSTIMAFGQSSESCGSVAYAGGGESCGSIAYSGGGESCGSVASSSSGSSMGGGCSYSC